MPLHVDQRGARLDGSLHDLAHHHPLRAQYDLAAPHPGNVEQVVQKVHQLPELSIDHVVRVVRLLRVAGRSQYSHPVHDRGQRVAQLMRKSGQELVFPHILIG